MNKIPLLVITDCFGDYHHRYHRSRGGLQRFFKMGDAQVITMVVSILSHGLTCMIWEYPT